VEWMLFVTFGSKSNEEKETMGREDSEGGV
jgi:hypothetical protein